MNGTAELATMTNGQCWDLLARGTIGRLAVSVQNKPDLFPVNYLVDGETIIIKTAPGMKLAAAILGAGIAFEVDELDHKARTGASVVIRGEAVEIEGLEELLDAEDAELTPWAGGHKNRFLRLVPSVVTGREISLA